MNGLIALLLFVALAFVAHRGPDGYEIDRFARPPISASLIWLALIHCLLLAICISLRGWPWL